MFKSRIFAVLKYLLFLGLGILLLYLAFKDVNMRKMLTDFKQAKLFWVFLSLICALLAFISRAHRWVILLRASGFNPGLMNSIYAVCLGYFANLAVPRIGEITRCTSYNQMEKIPVHNLLGTVILERTIDLMLLLTLTVLVIFLQADLFGGFLLGLFSEKLESIPFTTYLLLGIIFVTSLILLYVFRKKLGKFHFFIRAKAFIRGIIHGFLSVVKMRQKGLFILHTLFIWFMYYLMTYVTFFCLEETSTLGPVDGLFVLVLGGIGMSAPVQGGIGVFHLMVEAGLTLYGIEPHVDPVSGEQVSPGLLYATIVHTSQTLLVLLVGSISLIMFYIQKRKVDAKEPPGGS